MRDVIADLMKKRKMSQKELAKHMGVTPETVRRWLRGDRVPNWVQIQAIATFLDVGFNDIAEEDWS